MLSLRTVMQSYPWICMEEWRLAPRIPYLSTVWKWVVSLTPRPHYLHLNSHRYSLCPKLGGTQRRSGRREEEILDPIGTRTLLPLSRSARNFFLIGIVGVESNWVHSALRPAPGDCDDGEIGGMKIGRGNRSTLRKPAPVPLYPPQTPHALPGREPGPPRWEASD
jgi:hypothetical protein